MARSDEALNDAPTFLDLDSVPPLQILLYMYVLCSNWSNMNVACSDEALNDAPTFLDLDSVPPLQILYCTYMCYVVTGAI